MQLQFGTKYGTSQTRKPLTKKNAVIFLIIGTCLPLVFICVGAYSLYRNYIQNTKWNDVPAVVINSEIIEHKSTSRKGVSTVTYGANITYKYTIDGQEYIDTYESISSSNISYANEMLDKYQPDAQIIAKVNPDNHAQSVLPEKTSWLYCIILAMGIFLLIAFVSVGISMLKKAKSASKTPNI